MEKETMNIQSMYYRNKMFDFAAVQNWLEWKWAIHIKQGGRGKEGEDDFSRSIQMTKDDFSRSIQMEWTYGLSLIMFIKREVTQNNSSV